MSVVLIQKIYVLGLCKLSSRMHGRWGEPTTVGCVGRGCGEGNKEKGEGKSRIKRAVNSKILFIKIFSGCE